MQVTAALALLAIIATSAPAGAALPPALPGLWAGTPTTSVLGPWDAVFGIAIQKTANPDLYLVSDTVPQNMLAGAFQRFWMGTETLTYCGKLGAGFNSPDPTNTYGDIQFLTHAVDVGAKSAVFSASVPDDATSGSGSSWNLTYAFELVSDDALHLTVTFAAAHHLDVMLTRVGPAPVFPLVNKHPSVPHPCNHTATYLPGQADVPVPPAPPVPPPAPPAPRPCFTLNPKLNFSIAWDVVGDELHVTLSAAVDAVGTYLAIGFAGDASFPYMYGLDVVVGYASEAGGAACVRPMYVDVEFGPPVLSTKLEVSAPSVVHANGLLSVSFVRPLASGHNPLAALPVNVNPFARPLLYWATGSVNAGGGGCETDTIQYHGPNRGVHGSGWFHPTAVFAEWERCAGPAA